MIVKNQSLLIAYDTETQVVAGAIVTQDLYEDDGTPITTRTKPLNEVELAESLASIDSALLAERDELKLQVALLTQQLAETKEQLPFNPRLIDPVHGMHG